MPRLVALALALLISAPLASAQTPDSTLTADARALLFSIGPDLDLGSFNGSTISYKRHHSPTRARRVGLTVSGDATFFDADTENETRETEDASNQQSLFVAASAVGLRYRRGRTPVALYHGVGPRVSAQVNRQERDVAREPAGDRQSTIDTDLRLATGVEGVLGVEWVVSRAIGLTAEYGGALEAHYTRSRSTQQGGDLRLSRDEVGLGLRSFGARLGLSVYF